MGFIPIRCLSHSPANPNEQCVWAFLFKIPDGRLWFVILVLSLCIKLGGWGISPSAEGDQRAPPFGNLPLSRKRPKLLIRGYFVATRTLCTHRNHYEKKARKHCVRQHIYDIISIMNQAGERGCLNSACTHPGPY